MKPPLAGGAPEPLLRYRAPRSRRHPDLGATEAEVHQLDHVQHGLRDGFFDDRQAGGGFNRIEDRVRSSSAGESEKVTGPWQGLNFGPPEAKVVVSLLPVRVAVRRRDTGAAESMRPQKTSLLAPSRERIREAAKALFAERGYEATSTAQICRLAGTSQSQLIKHFTNKQGVLEALFEYAWEHINPAIRLAAESLPSPKEKLKILVDMVLNFLEKDRALRTLFLLEGRRLRGDGHMTVLVPGFLEFIKILDGILKGMAECGELQRHVNPRALRSALMGAIEGMLRDQLIARTARLPADYSETDVRVIFSTFLSACLSK